MDAQQIDNKLLSLLKGLPYFSVLYTCLQIKLSDHAAALYGCRSSRQIDESKYQDIDDAYCRLISVLQINIDECLRKLEVPHTYRSEILSMNESQLEVLLENTLYEMTICECKYIFSEYFLD